MRIAQIAPLYESIPPRLYGGTERVVSYLTEELVARGHDVTLFASADSETSARLVPVCERSLWNDGESAEALPHHLRLLELVFRNAQRFDLLHFHGDFLHLPLLSSSPVPSLTTVHRALNEHDHGPLFATYPDAPLVSISDDQRRPAPSASWRATIYHGLPKGLHTFRERPEGYLAFLGRMAPEKGLDRAIEIARLAGRTLKVAAHIPSDDRYYREVVQPLLESSRSFVEYVGEVGGAAKDAFLGGADALLFPIEWPEPFGLVMIEALACGTPVVAFRRGSVPEVLDDGVTGFLVNSVEEAAAAIANVGRLSRASCREEFDRRFEASRMAGEYLDVYRELAGAGRERSSRLAMASRALRRARRVVAAPALAIRTAE